MNIRRSFLALGAIILGFGALSTPAFAECAIGPIETDGDYSVYYEGDCHIPGSVTAAGSVSITATGSVTVDGPVSAGGAIFIQGQSGNVTTGAITSETDSIYVDGADITTNAINSGGEIGLNPHGDLTVNGGVSFVWHFSASAIGGDISISGPIAGSTPGYSVTLSALSSGKKITLGGDITAHDYGVNLSAGSTISTKNIDTSGTTSFKEIRIFPNQLGGTSPFLLGDGGVNGVAGTITANRTSGHANVAIDNPSGGIELDGSKINVQSSNGTAGGIFVNAPNGPVKVKGTLSVNGSAGQRAGLIVLVGDTITTTGGAQIRSDDTVTTNHNHYVVLTGSSLTYTGGLTLSVKGNTSSGLYLMPKGSQSLYIPLSSSSPISPGTATPQRAAMTITSTDSGKLTMNVDGRNNRVIMSAYPMAFSGGPIDIHADRSNVYFQYAGSAANNNSLVFNGGTINVYANSSIAGENAGTIHLWADKLATPVPAINLYANEGKDGGTVEIIAANGTIPIGVGAGKIKVEAKAGIGNGGKGGTVIIYGQVQDLNDQESILATGDGSGEGGNVTILQASGKIDPGLTVQGINVPMVIRVDGGAARVAGDSYGSISLNYVTCKQWKTNAPTYPRFAWDCITPDTGANIATLVSAGASLSSTLQLDLAVLVSPPPANPMVGVYAMNNLYDFQKFFGKPLNPPYDNVYGDNHRDWLRVAATFKNSSNGDNATLSGSPTIMVGALVHELGHHLDFIFGPSHSTLSSQTAWTSLGTPDFAFMDSQPCNGVFFQTTCNNNPGKTNSQIFAIRFPGINNADERFAAMFEHVESVLTGNPPLYQAEPELEKALEALPQQKQYMMNLIANPPTPNN